MTSLSITLYLILSYSFSSPLEAYEGLDVREQQHSDTESIEKASLGSSSAETELSHSTPLMQR